MDYLDHLKQYANQPLSHQLLVSILGAYQRPNDKIHALINEGVLQSIKKGLYIAGPKLNVERKPEPFLLANHIMGPSYVSLETALSFYGIIPERVYEIASITTKSSRQFDTPEGKFTYTRMSLPYYCFGIRSVKLTDDQYAIVASPEKALCDKIITTSGLLLRSSKSVKEFLLDDMRMDEEKLKELNTHEMSTWLEGAIKRESLTMLINALKEI